MIPLEEENSTFQPCLLEFTLSFKEYLLKAENQNRPLNQISRTPEDSLHNKAASGLRDPFPHNVVVGLISLVYSGGNCPSLDVNLASVSED